MQRIKIRPTSERIPKPLNAVFHATHMPFSQRRNNTIAPMMLAVAASITRILKMIFFRTIENQDILLEPEAQ